MTNSKEWLENRIMDLSDRLDEARLRLAADERVLAEARAFHFESCNLTKSLETTIQGLEQELDALEKQPEQQEGAWGA